MASLDDVATQLGGLGNKQPGELIWAGQGGWNDLVGAIAEMNGVLESSLAAVGARLDDLGSRLDRTDAQASALADELAAARDDLASFRQEVEPQSYRVTTQSTKGFFALGEAATIEAHVTDLRGGAVTATRPWVDFITSWGHFIPADGFEAATLGGAAGLEFLAVTILRDD